MTGREALARQYPQATNIFRAEREAWQAYVGYIIGRMPPDGTGSHVTRELQGDDESRRLFSVWRSIRNERDGISNPRHRANRQHEGRFSTRGER